MFSEDDAEPSQFCDMLSVSVYGGALLLSLAGLVYGSVLVFGIHGGGGGGVTCPPALLNLVWWFVVCAWSAIGLALLVLCSACLWIICSLLCS